MKLHWYIFLKMYPNSYIEQRCLMKYLACDTKMWSKHLRYVTTIMKIKQMLHLFTFEINQSRFAENSFQIYEDFGGDLFITRLEVYSLLQVLLSVGLLTDPENAIKLVWTSYSEKRMIFHRSRWNQKMASSPWDFVVNLFLKQTNKQKP